jgi:hypothetical protein
LRFRESKAFGLEYASIRAVVSQSTSYRMVLPPSIGVVDYCLKRGATVVDGDGVNSIPLRFDVCAPSGGSEWITATHDGYNIHQSSVWSNTATDLVEWAVRRARGTEAVPANVVTGDAVSRESYQARIGGANKNLVAITVNRSTDTATSSANWRLSTYDSSGTPFDKILVENDVLINSELEVNGNLRWTADGGGDIGLPTSGRPNSVHATSAYYVYASASPTALLRGTLSAGGLTIRNAVDPGSTGAGTTTFSITSSSGNTISSGTANFTTYYSITQSGTNYVGIDGVFSVSGCTLTMRGGIVINRTC